MTPYYQDEYATIFCGDNREILPTLEPVDAIVTDPPYGLRFMGKRWDYDVPAVEAWRLCFDLLKPGGHLLSFAGTRTQHRMAVNIEDAGFEIRDMIAWVYGSGFPKSLDVSKAIDKAAGAEREVVGVAKGAATQNTGSLGAFEPTYDITAPATEAARQWNGYGTALKPALEPITVARKPFPGTVAANVLEHGTGALNIDGSGVGTETTITVRNGNSGEHGRYGKDKRKFTRNNPRGRFPANLIHDGSEEVLAGFPETAPSTARPRYNGEYKSVAKGRDLPHVTYGHADSGNAARFFYCAKASKADRGPGNDHPTVKPIDLMRYLCQLVTAPGQTLCDPYMGSGTTLVAARMHNIHAIGITLDEHDCEIAARRLSQGVLPLFEESPE